MIWINIFKLNKLENEMWTIWKSVAALKTQVWLLEWKMKKKKTEKKTIKTVIEKLKIRKWDVYSRIWKGMGFLPPPRPPPPTSKLPPPPPPHTHPLYCVGGYSDFIWYSIRHKDDQRFREDIRLAYWNSDIQTGTLSIGRYKNSRGTVQIYRIEPIQTVS